MSEFAIASNEIALYHFTCQEYLSDILIDDYLKPSDSRISAKREHAGPDVVWLTTLSQLPTIANGEDAAARMAFVGSQFDKTAIRFTVKVHKKQAYSWRKWAESYGIDREWLQTLARDRTAGTWYVVPRAVPRKDWLEIRDMRTDQIILSNQQNGVVYRKPLDYDFESQYTQADIDEAYWRAAQEAGDRFDVPDEWTS